MLLAKHLCASASDAAVALYQRMAAAVARSSACSDGSVILACAPCCHHKGLDYASYAGRGWWERQGLDEREFQLARQLIFLSKATEFWLSNLTFQSLAPPKLKRRWVDVLEALGTTTRG